LAGTGDPELDEGTSLATFESMACILAITGRVHNASWYFLQRFELPGTWQATSSQARSSTWLERAIKSMEARELASHCWEWHITTKSRLNVLSLLIHEGSALNDASDLEVYVGS
jgi:hypothetical protein